MAIQGSRVLIVDDHETNRVILEEMATNWGMECVQADTVESAQRALHAAKEVGSPFRLVLSDVNMPGVDGFDFAEWIRAHIELADLPIILLTSGGRMGDIQRRDELGIAAHLMKPVKQSELYNAVVRALGVATPSEESESAPAPVMTRPLSVLLAEDSHFNQKLAVTLLERKGHTVTVASTGRQAVERFTEQEFDVVLMDVQMPEMDGLEATVQIRELECASGTPRTPIIAMTAHALKGDRENCLDMGMDEYVSKPIDPAQLFAAIEHLVRDSEDEVVLAFDEEAELQLAAEPEEAARPEDAGDEPDDSNDVEVGESVADGVVDFDAAKERVGGRMETVKTLALILLGECPKLMGQLREAIDGQHAKEMRRAAHTIKGSSSHFLAKHVVAAAEVLERLGEQASFDDAEEAYAKLETEVDRMTGVIKATFGG